MSQIEELKKQAEKFIAAADEFLKDPTNAEADEAVTKALQETAQYFAAVWFEDTEPGDIVRRLFE